MSRKSRRELIGDCGKLTNANKDFCGTNSDCLSLPGKVPGAEDTKMIKKRSLPLRLSQSNGRTHT